MTEFNYPIEELKNRSVIVDKKNFFDTSLVSIPQEYQPYLSKVVLSYGFIVDRIQQISRQILEEMNNQDITFLVVMKSALLYSNYLLKFITEIKKDIKFGGSTYFEYISSSSYSDDKSTGDVKINTAESVFKNLKGKNVIIVEDMYDSGLSLNHLLNYLNRFELNSLKISSLFVKMNPKNLQYKLHIDYIGFTIPDDTFIVGFGMDFNELFRDLNHSCVVSPDGLKLLQEKFKK